MPFSHGSASAKRSALKCSSESRVGGAVRQAPSPSPSSASNVCFLDDLSALRGCAPREQQPPISPGPPLPAALAGLVAGPSQAVNSRVPFADTRDTQPLAVRTRRFPARVLACSSASITRPGATLPEMVVVAVTSSAVAPGDGDAAVPARVRRRLLLHRDVDEGVAHGRRRPRHAAIALERDERVVLRRAERVARHGRPFISWGHCEPLQLDGRECPAPAAPSVPSALSLTPSYPPAPTCCPTSA